jgi:hypothetical protein
MTDTTIHIGPEDWKDLPVEFKKFIGAHLNDHHIPVLKTNNLVVGPNYWVAYWYPDRKKIDQRVDVIPAPDVWHPYRDWVLEAEQAPDGKTLVTLSATRDGVARTDCATQVVSSGMWSALSSGPGGAWRASMDLFTNTAWALLNAFDEHIVHADRQTQKSAP